MSKCVQDYTVCRSDCTLDVETTEGELLHYDFSALSNVTGFRSSPRFTSKGLRYFHDFSITLCGKEVRGHDSNVYFFFFKEKMCINLECLLQPRAPATCVDNVTESGSEVKGFVCQSTAVPSGIRSQSLVSTQPVLIGDTLIGTFQL